MEFDYDPKKGASNKQKHGVDFIEAQQLWDDPNRLEIPARVEGEERVMLIGRLLGKHWSAIFTRRGWKTRIISVRRSRKSEVDLYES